MEQADSTNLPDENALSERTVTATAVAASVFECFAIGADVERYPEWVAEIDSVEVLSRDEQGRVSTARFRAEGMGRSSQYVLRYDYSEAPSKLSWEQVDGDITRSISGSYEFGETESGHTDEPLTEVTYRLFIELAFSLPGFVKRRAEHKIVESALQRFKERAEG